MKTALFTNFTNKEFVGYWDGKPKKFKAGQSIYMPAYLAEHFAKHLCNKELLKRDDNGDLVYKNGEKFTSPKKPDEAPMFMKLFNKAYKLDEEDVIGNQVDDVDSLVDSINKNKEIKNELDIVEKKDNQDDEIVSEDSFGGSPIDLIEDDNETS